MEILVSACIKDRMHWLKMKSLENKSCFPQELCIPTTQLITYYVTHRVPYRSKKKSENQCEILYVRLYLHSQFHRQTEHLRFPRVPVEDLPQFIAGSRFGSGGASSKRPQCLKFRELNNSSGWLFGIGERHYQ